MQQCDTGFRDALVVTALKLPPWICTRVYSQVLAHQSLVSASAVS